MSLTVLFEVGEEAVKQLVSASVCKDAESALVLGNRLLDAGVFCHVSNVPSVTFYWLKK
jgi:hypothetical protein